MRDLPPLSALRAFETVGRRKSLKLAAEELNVTHGAVSKQVRALEAHLGMPLIKRQGRGIDLTPEGRRMAEQLSKAFDDLDGAVRSADSRAFDETVIINCMPALVANWLLPRLHSFRKQYPKIQLTVYSATQASPQIKEQVDAHIIYGRPDWPGKRVLLLRRLEIFPICSPKFANSARLEKLNDLLNQVLIDNPEETHWQDFLLSHGLDSAAARQKLKFQDFSHCLAAARSGHGIAMGDNVTASSDLAAGTLVRPFREAIKRQSLAYYLITRPNGLMSASAEAFCNWLIMEIGED